MALNRTTSCQSFGKISSLQSRIFRRILIGRGF
jgi:hypothetical protein